MVQIYYTQKLTSPKIHFSTCHKFAEYNHQEYTVYMLTAGFDIIVEDGKFYGTIGAVNHDGTPIVLYHKTLTKEQVHGFILSVKLNHNQYIYQQGIKVNSIEDRLRVCKKLLQNNVKHVKEIMREYITHFKDTAEELSAKRRNSINETERIWLTQSINDFYVPSANEWERVIKAYSYKKDSDKKITDMDIVKAKDYSIKDLIQFGRDGKARCIFHNENTPSMKYYPENNTVHCFGCGVTADSIRVAQHIFGENFINTVKRLAGK